jgi:hypothetical protein
MAILTESEVRNAARRTLDSLTKSAAAILTEEASTSLQQFDIFLSHSIRDAELVLGAARLLKSTGKTVYVDWIVDPKLDRTKVNTETANVLRERMKQCKAFFYLYTKNATASRWMPWELGHFDGYNGNVAILPVLLQSESTFKGEEFLGLYPYVDLTAGIVWIQRGLGDYKRFDEWLTARDKLRPAG